jgi:membrane protein DedA with SNARE-associated domain
VTHLIETYGLWLLFCLIMLESTGIPLPGETALIAAAVASERGHLAHIWWVIVVAAAAAIIGDNFGYWAGREGVLKLLRRWKRIAHFEDRVIPPAERFFAKHGGKTVFFGRFIALLRITAAWLAGMSGMPWWRFFAWNASGGIVWATTVGLVAYFLGKGAAGIFEKFGYGAAAVLVIGLIVTFFGLRHWKKRLGLEGEKA